jgi:Ran GTPase-activating protein (RanGAP) involved in mRNA processing and transport
MSRIKSAFTSLKKWLSPKLYHAYYRVYSWFSREVNEDYNYAMEILAENKDDPESFSCSYVQRPLTLEIIAHELASNNTIEFFSLFSCRLNDKSIKIIADLLQSNPNLRTIELVGNHIDEGTNNSALRVLFNAIKNLNLLKKLNLSTGKWFKSDNLEPDFFDFFKTSSIKEINFCNTGLGQNAANSLFASLRENKTVAKVYLGSGSDYGSEHSSQNEKFTAAAMVDLVAFIDESKTLRDISFLSSEESLIKSAKDVTEKSETVKQVKIGNKSFYGLYLVQDKLDANTGDKLDISKTHISIPALHLIVKFATVNKIQKLCLNECDLSFEHAKILAEFINGNPHLQHISLNKNDIGNEGAAILLNAIASSVALQTIAIREIKADNLFSLMAATFSDTFKNESCKIKSIDCSFNDHGVFRTSWNANPPAEDLSQSFMDMLTTNKSVVELNLDGSGIDTAGFQKIAIFLEGDKVLKKLVLSNNNRNTIKWDDAGIASLFAALANNTSLLELEMYRTNIQPNRAENIAAALKANRALVKLNLGYNQFPLSAAQLIVNAILENPGSKMRQLNFGLGSDARVFDDVIEAKRKESTGLEFFAFHNFIKKNRGNKTTLPSLPTDMVKLVDEMLGSPRPLKIT